MTAVNSQINGVDSNSAPVPIASHFIGGKDHTGHVLVGPTGEIAEPGPFLYSRKTADGQVKSSAGFLHCIAISPLTASPTPGLLTIYDSTTEAGTIIFQEWIFATAPARPILFDVAFANGLYVGFDGALADVQVTVSYR